MNKAFVDHALQYGNDGENWHKKIPSIIDRCRKKWSIVMYPPFELSYNYVAPAIKADGTPVVLKIGYPKDIEFISEIEALTVFNGDGVVKLFEKDREHCAILLERITPGLPLTTIENDQEATRILASVIKKIKKPLPKDHSFITIDHWTAAISRYQTKYRNVANTPLPLIIADEADELFKKLIATSEPSVLVHGDLHHDNVLSSDRSGWVAIDPKGVAAEPAYETAAMLRNPKKLRGNTDLQTTLSQRISILSEELEIKPERIKQWGIAQTILSAIWTTEEQGSVEFELKLIDTLKKISV